MDYSYLHFIGKHIIKDQYEYLSYSGTGFSFLLIPTKSNCAFTLSLISEMTECEKQYIAIFINDVFHSKETINIGENSIHIALFDNTPIKVTVIKLNEAYVSCLYLKDIILNNASFGELKILEKPLIKYYGDSLTCGYGLLDYQGDTFTTEGEDFLKSYAYLTAKELNMDYSVIARSGISVALKIYCDKTFLQIYDTVDMFIKCHPIRPADYAIINLGTNDSEAFKISNSKENDTQLFEKEYKALIDQIIKDNPSTKIILCYGMGEICEELLNAIKKVVEYIKKQFQNPCVLLYFPFNHDGASNHPYYTAHEEYAKILIEQIRKIQNL